MKKSFFRIFLISALFLLFLSFFLCRISEYKKNGSETSEEQLQNITFYPSNSSVPSGLVKGFKGRLLKELGISVEILPYSAEKTDAMIYSGSLADIIVVPYDKLDKMIEEGMLLNLDNYIEKMPNLGNNSLQISLKYIREYKSAGTGNLYCLPSGVGMTVRQADTGRNALRLNWDAYEKIGAPVIHDIWDLIPVMKKMLEATPTNSDGETCYGTFLNSDSDGTYWGNIEMFFKWFGYEPTNLPYLLETDMVHGTYHSILNESSLYYEGLKWYNAVYRENLMDPDSINTDRATQKTKVEKQHLAMVPSGTCPGWAPYYLQYWLPGTSLYAEHFDNPYGNSQYSLAINAKSKNIDGALTFLNALSDPDFLLTVKCGPSGDAWYEKDGITHISDKMLNCAVNGIPYLLEESGERLENWGIEFVIGSSIPTSYVGPDGNSRSCNFTDWIEVSNTRTNNPTYLSWKKTLGNYNDFTAYLEGHNAYTLNSKLDNLEYFSKTPGPEIQSAVDLIKDIVVTASWQMVYANSDEEFQTIWNQMVKDCEDSEADKIIEWRLKELESAMQKREALKKH